MVTNNEAASAFWCRISRGRRFGDLSTERVIDRAALNKIISVIRELEFTLKKPFNRFIDTVGADAIDLNLEYLRGVTLYRRRFYGNRPPIRVAILATDSTLADYGRLHAPLTEGSPITVRVFQNRNEAAEWLGVPVELLAPKPVGDKSTTSYKKEH